MAGTYGNRGNRKRIYQFNVVEFVISKFFKDCASEFGRRLQEVAKKEISRQAIQGWRNRGFFSRDIVPHVHSLTGVPIIDLITKPKINPIPPKTGDDDTSSTPKS